MQPKLDRYTLKLSTAGAILAARQNASLCSNAAGKSPTFRHVTYPN